LYGNANAQIDENLALFVLILAAVIITMKKTKQVGHNNAMRATGNSAPNPQRWRQGMNPNFVSRNVLAQRLFDLGVLPGIVLLVHPASRGSAP